MIDKEVVSEKMLRCLLALLEKQSKKDADTILKLWQQLMPETNIAPRLCV
jgi:hypothetical protein